MHSHVDHVKARRGVGGWGKGGKNKAWDRETMFSQLESNPLGSSF